MQPGQGGADLQGDWSGGKLTPSTSHASDIKPRLLTTQFPIGLFPTRFWVFDLMKTLVRGGSQNSAVVERTQALQIVDSRLSALRQEGWGTGRL